MKPNRIIVAGSRTFADYALLDRKLSHILQRLTPDDTVIVSGTARGADRLAEHWAGQHRFEVLRFPAQWNVHGRRAGYVRNEQMLEVATGLVAFWDGQSRGTAHMIDIARKKGIKVVVVQYQARCICTDFLNFNPDPIPNPDCPLHGAGFAT